jgi:DNA-binding NarL/FixJ family response regulator
MELRCTNKKASAIAPDATISSNEGKMTLRTECRPAQTQANDPQGGYGAHISSRIGVPAHRNGHRPKPCSDYSEGVDRRPLQAIETVIVTDVALMRDGLARALESQAFVRVVGAATTPAEALAVVMDRRPAVVLLDMSTTLWLGIVPELRHALPRVCVVAFSVGDNDEEILACVEAGVVGFVLKGGTTDDLVAACETAARGEAHCPARIVTGLCRRLATLALLAMSSVPTPSLSPRELEIVELIDRGLPNKAIARQRSIGLPTVKNHVHNILEKLHVATRGEAAAVLRGTASGTQRGLGGTSKPLVPRFGRTT